MTGGGWTTGDRRQERVSRIGVPLSDIGAGGGHVVVEGTGDRNSVRSVLVLGVISVERCMGRRLTLTSFRGSGQPSGGELSSSI